MSVDRDLFLLINSFAGNATPLDLVARLLVNDYFVPTTLSLLLIAFWFEGDGENQKAVLRTIVAVLVASALVKAFNLIYFRPRPFSDMEVNLLFYRPGDSSFPSNPAAVAFAFAATVWPHNRRLGLLMGLLASLFALARVYAGVHYPFDVVGGGLLGILAAIIARRFDLWLKPIFDLILRLSRRLKLN